MTQSESPTPGFLVYVAAPRSSAARANELAQAIRAAGHTVVSRWHKDAEPLVDPAASMDRGEVLFENTVDLESADLLVALMDEGLPRATYGEIGWALACDKRVIWLSDGDETTHGPRACIYDSHPRVTRIYSLSDVLPVVEQMWTISGPNIDTYRATETLRTMANRLRIHALLNVSNLKGKLETPSHESTMHLVGGVTGEAALQLAKNPGDSLSPLLWLKYALDVLAGSMMLASTVDEDKTAPAEKLN